MTGVILTSPISKADHTPPAQILSFTSLTPASFGQLLRAPGTAEKITIQGELLLPESIAGPVPAVIVKHGSAGVQEARDFMWARFLNELGIAAFVVDSFGPRGIEGTVTDFSQYSGAADIADAIFALRRLSQHPDIDPTRIGVMGFSLGGMVAIETMFEEYGRALLGGGPRFKAHIAFYPAGCSLRRWSPNIIGAPMLMLLGARDDGVPAGDCLDFAELLRPYGANIHTLVFPNAYHSFDVAAWAVHFNPELPTRRACSAQVRLDTFELSRYDVNEVFASTDAYRTYLDSCLEHGYSGGGDASAATQAKANVRAFLEQVFQLGAPASPLAVADLRLNGEHGPVQLAGADTLDVDVTLSVAGDHGDGDYWFGIATPTSAYFLTATGWTTEQTPAYQGPLRSLDIRLLSEIPLSDLPTGYYTVYFGFDALVDGKLSPERLYYDFGSLEIID